MGAKVKNKAHSAHGMNTTPRIRNTTLAAFSLDFRINAQISAMTKAGATKTVAIGTNSAALNPAVLEADRVTRGLAEQIAGGKLGCAPKILKPARILV